MNSEVRAARINGRADEAYGPVVDVFAANFRDRWDLGAACAVYVSGRKVVDVWGGTADQRSGRAWSSDTAAVIFSCTKGIVAICAYLLVQDGRLDLDAPVTRYWPEFGRSGKADIRVRTLLSHRAGLSALDRDLTLEDVVRWEPVIRAIEEQAPLWPPETAYEYHSMTYGWLIGEVIRRDHGLNAGRLLRSTAGRTPRPQDVDRAPGRRASVGRLDGTAPVGGGRQRHADRPAGGAGTEPAPPAGKHDGWGLRIPGR